MACFCKETQRDAPIDGIWLITNPTNFFLIFDMHSLKFTWLKLDCSIYEDAYQ